MVKVLPTVPSSEGRENFPEAVPVIAEIPLVLPSLEGHGKLGTTRTTVWFMVEYCQFWVGRLTSKHVQVTLSPPSPREDLVGCTRRLQQVCPHDTFTSFAKGGLDEQWGVLS